MRFTIDLLGGKNLQENITNYYLKKRNEKMVAQIFIDYDGIPQLFIDNKGIPQSFVVEVIYRKGYGKNGREDGLYLRLFAPYYHNQELEYDIKAEKFVNTETLYNMIFTMKESEVVTKIKRVIRTMVNAEVTRFHME